MPMSPHIADLRAKIGHALIMAPGVAVVIPNERGEVVLQRRTDNGLWGVPGGGIEPGEEPAETVIREVWEETGLKVVPERIAGVYGGADLRHVYPNQDVVQLIDIVFICRVVGGELAIQHDNESLEVRYFALDALPDDMMAHHKMYVVDAIRGNGTAHFRYQP